jgi:hypothetical protein
MRKDRMKVQGIWQQDIFPVSHIKVGGMQPCHKNHGIEQIDTFFDLIVKKAPHDEPQSKCQETFDQQISKVANKSVDHNLLLHYRFGLGKIELVLEA